MAEADLSRGHLWRLPPYEGISGFDIQSIWNRMRKMTGAEQAFLTLSAVLSLWGSRAPHNSLAKPLCAHELKLQSSVDLLGYLRPSLPAMPFRHSAKSGKLLGLSHREKYK